MSLGNQNNPLAARMQGVRTARDVSSGQGTGQSSTVTHVMDGKVVFVGFNDERGNPQVAMYFDVGGQLYAPSDTVAWCSRLLPITDWMAAGVAGLVKDREPPNIPTQDAVDIVLGGNEESGGEA